MELVQRVYRKARRKLGIDVELDKRIIFFHQPKCGGTSVSDALLAQYPKWRAVNVSIMEAQSSVHQMRVAGNFSEWIREYRRFKEFLLLYHLNCQKHLVIGHLPFSNAVDEAFGGQYQYAAVFRDPAKRFISHYKFQKLLVDTPFNFRVPERPFANLEDELEAFLSSEEAANWGSSYAVDNSGISDWEGDIPVDRMTDAAIENLKKFSFLGHTEDIPNLLDRLQSRLGGRFSLKRSNTTESLYRDDQQKAELGRLFKDSTVLARINELCQPNYRVYKAALALEK